MEIKGLTAKQAGVERWLPGMLMRLAADDLIEQSLMRPVGESAQWESLPLALRTAIEARTGTGTATSPAGEGLSTSVRLILHTQGTSPDSMPYQRDRLALGADLAPYLTAVSAPLLWRASADGWDVTGWAALPGRPRADLTPGSTNFPVITGLLAELSETLAPAILTVTTRQYWAQYTDAPGMLAGDAIVHGDPNPTNFVIGPHRAWMVDFGWAARGPAWMTSANLITCLMEAGWKAADADSALKAVPAWASAPRHAVDELARASVREWERAAQRGPLHPMWQHRAAVTRTWADYRDNTTRF